MNERDNDPNKAAPNFDRTTPNIPLPHQSPRPPQHPSGQQGGGGGFDRTAINTPFAPRDASRPTPSGGQPRSKFDLTSINFNAPSDADDDDDVAYSRRSAPPVAPPPPPMERTMTYPPVQQQQLPPQPQSVFPQPSPQQAAPKRGVPVWVWFVGGGMLAVLLAVLAVGGFLFYQWNNATFTLRVSNTPPGSKVFIDGAPSGVSQADGTIVVQSLRANEQREVRVTSEGYAEWETTVKGESGETKDVAANLAPLEVKATLPAEIDYGGKMALVAAGAFTMGDDSHNPDESPAHQVTLPDYYIDKHEVTNEQYKKFCDATGHPVPANPFWDLQYFENNPQQPVIGVSFADAVAYAGWANKRLPTEEEWEKAASWDAKANRKRQWPWGDDPDPGRANVDSNHPKNVGYFVSGASPYGLHDMAGNAFEWVDALYRPYAGNTAPNPKYAQNLRVVRGGDFRRGLDVARTTFRNIPAPPTYSTSTEDAKNMKSSLVGFRTAVSANDQKLRTFLQQLKK